MSEEMTQGYTIGFGEPGADELDLVGGKGANLGQLVSAGFEVPAGFTVSTRAHRAAMRSDAVATRLAELTADLDYSDPAALERHTAAVRELIEGAELLAGIADAIDRAYRGLGEGIYVAVRSSGTAEDLADASFAGLHDTFLDVRGEAEVKRAVRACWASMWTARATAYRHERGFDHGDAALAVVVQVMVESEVSGVLFTANPLTAATDELVVNASFGLGESVVGGVVNPDQYVVAAADRRVLERTNGSKATQVVRDPDRASGTVTVPTPANLAGSFSLSDAQVSELASLGVRVQNHYGGFPQDIEWGLAEGRFYLLQSRPITGVRFSWDADLEETNINRRVEDDWIWTRAFADSIHTGGICPMTYSARFTYGMNRCWNDIANYAGIDELAGLRIWKYYRGELYYNCAWEKVWAERMVFPFARSPEALGMVPQDWREDIARTPFETLKYVKGLLRTELLDPRVYRFQAMMAEWRANRFDDVHGLSADRLRELSDAELKAYIKRQLETEVEYGSPVVAALIAHMSALMGVLGLLLAKWYDGGDPMFTFTTLISGSRSRTDTQVENQELWELSQLIRHSTELRALFDTHQGADFFTACGDSPAGREFLEQYVPFRAKYGHRGHADRDLLYERREEDPGRDYPAFKALLSVAEPVDPHEQELVVNRRREDTLDAVLDNVRRKPFGGLRVEVLKLLYSKIHDYIEMRDNERQFPNDAVIMSYKRGFNEVGRRLHERGLIDSARDVYFLGEPEAYPLLDGDTSRLQLSRAKIEARRADVEKRRRNGAASMPKYLRRGLPVDLDTPVSADAGDGVLQGMPTSSGLMTGTARVVHDLSGIGDVRDGEILVTNSTDPGWTPVFLVIKGVVVETGGLLSHASCLAREYGFPAAQLEGATTLIPDGATITLDGTTGRVTVH